MTNLSKLPSVDRLLVVPAGASLIETHGRAQSLRVERKLEMGSRGNGDDTTNGPLRELTGAKAATVVNNNATAVFL